MFHQRGASSSHSPATVDIITYRLEDEMMYVPVAPNYKQAIGYVRDAFPNLKEVKDSSITLTRIANVMIGSQQPSVGITAAVWPRMIPHLLRYEVIDIRIKACIPDITVTPPVKSEAAPPYRGPEETTTHNEKAPSHSMYSPSQSCSPSPGPSAAKLSLRRLLQKLNISLN
ncbi:hypothetical protein BU15DRAFT_62538 [Melanogaster broomeanus]|nr:hypothetical protein BU15DRAFT_62538 [Melanogaster broomeanus]